MVSPRGSFAWPRGKFTAMQIRSPRPAVKITKRNWLDAVVKSEAFPLACEICAAGAHRHHQQQHRQIGDRFAEQQEAKNASTPVAFGRRWRCTHYFQALSTLCLVHLTNRQVGIGDVVHGQWVEKLFDMKSLFYIVESPAI